MQPLQYPPTPSANTSFSISEIGSQLAMEAYTFALEVQAASPSLYSEFQNILVALGVLKMEAKEIPSEKEGAHKAKSATAQNREKSDIQLCIKNLENSIQKFFTLYLKREENISSMISSLSSNFQEIARRNSVSSEFIKSEIKTSEIREPKTPMSSRTRELEKLNERLQQELSEANNKLKCLNITEPYSKYVHPSTLSIKSPATPLENEEINAKENFKLKERIAELTKVLGSGSDVSISHKPVSKKAEAALLGMLRVSRDCMCKFLGVIQTIPEVETTKADSSLSPYRKEFEIQKENMLTLSKDLNYFLNSYLNLPKRLDESASTDTIVETELQKVKLEKEEIEKKIEEVLKKKEIGERENARVFLKQKNEWEEKKVHYELTIRELEKKLEYCHGTIAQQKKAREDFWRKTSFYEKNESILKRTVKELEKTIKLRTEKQIERYNSIKNILKTKLQHQQDHFQNVFLQLTNKLLQYDQLILHLQTTLATKFHSALGMGSPSLISRSKFQELQKNSFKTIHKLELQLHNLQQSGIEKTSIFNTNLSSLKTLNDKLEADNTTLRNRLKESEEYIKKLETNSIEMQQFHDDLQKKLKEDKKRYMLPSPLQITTNNNAEVITTLEIDKSQEIPRDNKLFDRHSSRLHTIYQKIEATICAVENTIQAKTYSLFSKFHNIDTIIMKKRHHIILKSNCTNILHKLCNRIQDCVCEKFKIQQPNVEEKLNKLHCLQQKLSLILPNHKKILKCNNLAKTFSSIQIQIEEKAKFINEALLWNTMKLSSLSAKCRTVKLNYENMVSQAKHTLVQKQVSLHLCNKQIPQSVDRSHSFNNFRISDKKQIIDMILQFKSKIYKKLEIIHNKIIVSQNKIQNNIESGYLFARQRSSKNQIQNEFLEKFTLVLFKHSKLLDSKVNSFKSHTENYLNNIQKRIDNTKHNIFKYIDHTRSSSNNWIQKFAKQAFEKLKIFEIDSLALLNSYQTPLLSLKQKVATLSNLLNSLKVKQNIVLKESQIEILKYRKQYEDLMNQQALFLKTIQEQKEALEESRSHNADQSSTIKLLKQSARLGLDQNQLLKSIITTKFSKTIRKLKIDFKNLIEHLRTQITTVSSIFPKISSSLQKQRVVFSDLYNTIKIQQRTLKEQKQHEAQVISEYKVQIESINDIQEKEQKSLKLKITEIEKALKKLQESEIIKKEENNQLHKKVNFQEGVITELREACSLHRSHNNNTREKLLSARKVQKTLLNSLRTELQSVKYFVVMQMKEIEEKYATSTHRIFCLKNKIKQMKESIAGLQEETFSLKEIIKEKNKDLNEKQCELEEKQKEHTRIQQNLNLQISEEKKAKALVEKNYKQDKVILESKIHFLNQAQQESNQSVLNLRKELDETVKSWSTKIERAEQEKRELIKSYEDKLKKETSELSILLASQHKAQFCEYQEKNVQKALQLNLLKSKLESLLVEMKSQYSEYQNHCRLTIIEGKETIKKIQFRLVEQLRKSAEKKIMKIPTLLPQMLHLETRCRSIVELVLSQVLPRVTTLKNTVKTHADKLFTQSKIIEEQHQELDKIDAEKLKIENQYQSEIAKIIGTLENSRREIQKKSELLTEVTTELETTKKGAAVRIEELEKIISRQMVDHYEAMEKKLKELAEVHGKAAAIYKQNQKLVKTIEELKTRLHPSGALSARQF